VGILSGLFKKQRTTTINTSNRKEDGAAIAATESSKYISPGESVPKSCKQKGDTSIVNEFAEAARHGDIQRIRTMAGKGLDIDATDENGWTALMTVAYSWEKDAVKLLLDEGASPGVSNSPYHSARSLAIDGPMGAREICNDEYCDHRSMEILALLDSAAKVEGVQKKATSVVDQVNYGGFGEPYCSRSCYDRAGEEIMSRLMREVPGVCAFCQIPVKASLKLREPVLFPFRSQIFHVCASCLPKGTDYVKAINECCMCGKPCPKLTPG
jgi:hypothetical protein